MARAHLEPPVAQAHLETSRPRAFLSDGTTLLLAAWCLLVIGASLNRGDWEISALVCLILGFIVAVATIALRLPVELPHRKQLALPIATCVIAAIAHPAAASMHIFGAQLHVIQILAAGAAITAAAGLFAWPRKQPIFLAFTALLGLTVGILVIVFERHPPIDVWAILQQSSTGLLHGDDMYRQHWQDGYGLKNVYPYLPWQTIVIAPFRLIFGDARVAMIVATLTGVWLLRRMSPVAPVALASLVLVSPHWAFYIASSWTEPTLMVMLFATFLLIARDRPGWAMLTFALALACKQPIVLLLPVFAIWPSFGWRRAIGSGLIALAAVSPWIIAGPRDFWHDAVDANLDLGTLSRALSIPSGLSHAGVHLGFGLLAAMLIATYAAIYFRMAKTPAGLALACALVVFAYDLANTQSFFNHYQFAAELLIAGLALSPDAGSKPGSGASSTSRA